MPLRPFPLPYSIGTDIVHINRFRNILLKSQEKSGSFANFLRRFLTPREQKIFASQYDVSGSLTEKQSDVVSKHLAGRWAAKEATIKAVTWRRLSFHDVVILRSPGRRGVAAIILDNSTTEREPSSSAVLAVENSEALDTGENEKQLELVDQSSRSPETVGDVDTTDIRKTEDVAKDDSYDDVHGQIARISISHDGEYATAVCLAVEDSMTGDVGGEAAAGELF